MNMKTTNELEFTRILFKALISPGPLLHPMEEREWLGLGRAGLMGVHSWFNPHANALTR